MAEVTSLLSPIGDSNILAVQAFKGLHLEPPTKDVVEIDGDAEPVTKEEEVVTKKKTELTTTRQIETRVKRQVVLEDGKVVQDSGPIVETNTTEDTDKQESETTERRKLGDDAVDGPAAIETAPIHGALANVSSGLVRAVVSRPDGLVREVKTKTVVSREEIDERLETEDVKILGDFSDEAYVNAVNSGKDIKSTLLSGQRQIVPIGSRIVHQSTKAHKTVDTEDVDLKCLAQPDGTLVTEKKKTTEHEELFDEDLPEKDDNSTGSRERVDQKESSQRFYKQRDEQAVEYVADGKVIGKEIKYAAETEQMDKDLYGPMENPSDWDSLSDRLRKTRRNQKTLLQQHREALLGDRKDALTERPLDFDKEELTRKGETIKWLESHFGSESRSSKDSRDDDIEPTKKSFFNVTIKSNATTPTSGTAKPFPSSDYNGNVSAFSNVAAAEREINPKTKYFQGISEWSERKDSSPRNFPPKSFQEELKGTLERNRNRHRVGSREELRPSRLVKDEVDFKRSGKTEQRFGSRGDLRYRRNSNADSDDSRNLKAQKEDLGYLSARNDSKEELYAKSTKKQNGYLHREDSGYIKDSREDIRYLKNGREDSFIRDSGEDEKNYKDVNKSIIQRDDSAYVSSSTYFTAPRSPVPPQKMRTPDSGIPSPDNYDCEDVRPTVPQRKRVLEKKLRLTQNGYSPNQKRNNEPSPDYSPPSRSRSISPPTTLSQQLNGGMKKYQRTRFASETPRPTSTQTSQTQTASQPPKQNKVSTVIGNSLRKLVGKIRSASAERKMKMKSKRSPSPTTKSQQHQQSMTNGASTYQQYNVIDSHIGQSNRESSVVSGSRRERTIDRRGSSDVDMASPKQRYYLGEDPYGGSIYGKENRYDGVRPQRNHSSRRLRSEDVELYSPSRTLASSNYTTSQTLGRFSKSFRKMLVPIPESNGTLLRRHQLTHKSLALRSRRNDLNSFPTTAASDNLDTIENRRILKHNNATTSLDPIEDIENQCTPNEQVNNRLVPQILNHYQQNKVNLVGATIIKRRKNLSLSLNRDITTRPSKALSINDSINGKHSPSRKRLKTWEMHEYMQHQTGASSSNEYILPKSDDNSYNQKKQITSSMATLCNIGNTCYLNSVVYTLRFAPRFLHNLHHVCDDMSEINQKLVYNKGKSASLGRNIGGIQGSNTRSWSTKDLASIGSFVDVPKTNRQIATEKLHELYTHLYRNEVIESTEAFHADTFLNAVQDVSSIFEGNQQQDAHEFLMCVLDSIRETCNSLTKVITECPDIVANGFVSLPEKIEVQTTSQRKTMVQSLFRKLSKDDKSKSNRNDAPAKDADAKDTNNQKSSSIPNFDDELTCGHEKEKSVEKVNEKIKKMGVDFFTEDFEGVTCSSTKCLSCETITEQKETMIDLSVPITGYENMDQLDDPNLFIQNLCITREQFRGENKYRCEVCTGLTEAIRTVSYPILPRLLIIQLKRFSGGMEKINNYIPTPFNLQCFCSKCCLLPESEKLHTYRLYSVITHVGATLSVGHYIAYTTSLDNYKDYHDCPKDKRKHQQNSTCPIPPVGGQNTEKSQGLMKKYIFGKSKATSSGDVTRNLKNLNGSVKNLTNGIDKTAPNGSISCQSINCCGILMKNSPGTSLSSMNINGISDHLRHNNSYVDNLSNSSLNDDCGNNFGGSGSSFSKKSESMWFMCDDDKIKTMTQREFEELLSPNKKIMVTPYLLFYARMDLR